MATVGELLILVAGNNAPLTASLAASEAQLRGFSATAGAQGAATAGSFAGVAIAATAMAATTGLAIAGSTTAAANFQDQLAIINTIAHQTPEELNRTGEAIRAMAVSSGEPLSDLTGAFYDLLSAGVPVSQAMSVLGSSTTLAIGGLATTKQTVDLLTTAMNAYGLNAAGVAQATDQFALAIQDGKVKADQIAATFADIAPIAKTAGIGIDEISAAYAVMTARGVPAAEVTTQMNRAIIELLKPNADLNALQKETGLNFASIASQRGLVEALNEMRTAAKDAGIPFQDLFGRLEGLKFALATTGPEAARYRDELTAMHNATGTAAAQAAERMETFNRGAAELGNSIGDLGIEIGTGFLPGASELVHSVADAVQGVAAWTRENPGLANTILVLVTAISAMIASVIILGPIIGALATAFTVLLSPIVLVGAAIGGLAAHFGLLGEGPKAFVDGLASSFSSLLPATGPIRDAFNLLGDAISALPGIVAGAQSAIGDFVSTLQGVFASISPDVISAVTGAFSTLSGILSSAASAFGPLLSQIASFLTSAGFMQGVANAVATALGFVRGAIDAVVAVVSTVIGWITTFVNHLNGANDAARTGRGIFDALAGALQFIVNLFSNIIGVITTVVTAIIDVSNRTGFFTIVLNILHGAADAVNTVFGFIGDVLRSLFTQFGLVANIVSGALTTAFNILKGVFDGFIGVVKTIIDALQTLLDLAGKAAAAVGSIGGPSGSAKDFQDRFRDVYGRNPTRPEFEQFRQGTLPGFASGGVVPGPVGAPQLAIVHGGEKITPAGGGQPMQLTTHTHVHLDGREIAEVIERQLFDNAANYSSGFVGSPQTT